MTTINSNTSQVDCQNKRSRWKEICRREHRQAGSAAWHLHCALPSLDRNKVGQRLWCLLLPENQNLQLGSECSSESPSARPCIHQPSSTITVSSELSTRSPLPAALQGADRFSPSLPAGPARQCQGGTVGLGFLAGLALCPSSLSHINARPDGGLKPS